MIKASFTTRQGIIDQEYKDIDEAMANARVYVMNQKQNIAVVFEDGHILISEYPHPSLFNASKSFCQICNSLIDNRYIYCKGCNQLRYNNY